MDTLNILYDELRMKVHLRSSYKVFSQLFFVVDRCVVFRWRRFELWPAWLLVVVSLYHIL